MEIFISGLFLGAVLRHYLPNLIRSRREDSEPPMAEYVDIDMDNLPALLRRQAD